MQKLTGVNDSLLASIKLGDVEEIKYKSFDGRDIQGWIVKPPDFDASKKYPFILYIHGGPHAMYNVAFNHEFQCHAANGYVVLYTNPRGSTGYGQDFGNVIQYNLRSEAAALAHVVTATRSGCGHQPLAIVRCPLRARFERRSLTLLFRCC